MSPLETITPTPITADRKQSWEAPLVEVLDVQEATKGLGGGGSDFGSEES